MAPLEVRCFHEVQVSRIVEDLAARKRFSSSRSILSPAWRNNSAGMRGDAVGLSSASEGISRGGKFATPLRRDLIGL